MNEVLQQFLPQLIDQGLIVAIGLFVVWRDRQNAAIMRMNQENITRANSNADRAIELKMQNMVLEQAAKDSEAREKQSLQIVDLTKENVTLKGEIATLNIAMIRGRESADRAIEELQKTQAEGKARQVQWEGTLEEYRGQLRMKDQTISQQSRELVALKTTLGKLEARLNEIETELARVQVRYNEATEQRKTAEIERDSALQRVTDLESERDKLKERVAQLEAQLALHKQDLNKLETEIDELRRSAA